MDYPKWVSNVVMVKKTPKKWRMCMDFMDLNKAYLKDSFPLPIIDQLVNATAGFSLFSFLEAYYGATYQRLINRMFAKYVHESIEVYVDEILVKSLTTDQHVDRLAKMFAVPRQYKMWLNPAKCVFGVESRKFLGFMIS
ncbi:hypothetical protein L3X38_003444 [Prunus dulcis]|uniref:Reverse transcriptase domain-containing protein n=1 Tax=Prunus dulcis TaxID=3755 RepID=A0AAD5F227_PRUDU|nr:hypothetical protein L3X38_003444 [Prunus dulcis]